MLLNIFAKQNFVTIIKPQKKMNRTPSNLMGGIIQLKHIARNKQYIITAQRLQAQRMIANQKMIAMQKLVEAQTGNKGQKVLAFCFLTYDDVVRDDIWMKYFQNVSYDKYKIFVNSKTKDKILQSELFGDKQISHPVQDTKWGEFSLVTAQNALFKEALKNSKVTHLILVSHNTIPLKRFDELYDALQFHSIFDYNVAIEWEHKRRYYGIRNPKFRIENFFVQSQWCILTRMHANILVQDYNYIKTIFSQMRIPDEHCYINYLIHYKKALLITKQPSTFVDFSEGTPKVHKTVDNKLKSRCNDAFFIRKVSKDTDVQINF